MTETALFPVEKIKSSRLANTNLINIPFGRTFTDHMLEADFVNGNWQNVSIKPYAPLQLSPATAALHYGQAIFEGMKAYKQKNGDISVFRPYDNFKRFNTSAERMQMPKITEEIFIDGLKQLIELDKNWVPNADDHSLYIRPFMFSSDDLIGVRPSDNYKFLCILSPTGPYYTAPMNILVEEKYVRAVPGGVGYAKAAGNYGGAMYATAQAKLKGFDQVLWTDAFEHKYVQECGTMNVFFIIGDKAITPDLREGTILAGVNRDSTLKILSDFGFTVQERDLSMDEVIAAYNAGMLTEVFGTGTAATISYIKTLQYKESTLHFNVDHWRVAPAVKDKLDKIRYGIEPDYFNWMHKIC